MMINGFKYTTAIKKIRKMKARIKIIPGGTSAGKTFSILPILIDKAIKNPMTEISVVSESLPHLRKGAMKDFLKIMKMTNRFISSNWNKTNSIYTFTNGSYIEFFSAGDAETLRGARRNILYVNECNNIKKEAYVQLAMRTDGDIYLDYNPSHLFWVEEVKNEFESEVLKLTYKDNEALPISVINFLESKRKLAATSDYWANWCKVYLDGELGMLEGVVFNNWSEINKVPEEAKLIGAGLDFGYTNDPSSLTMVYKLDNTIILDEIIYRTGLLNPEISKLIKNNNIKCEIIADSAEPKSIAELKRYGHRVIGAKKGKDSINFGISILQEYDILITRRSNNIKNEFNKYSWKKDREGNHLNIPEDLNNHAIDGIRYLAMAKLTKKRSGRTFKIR
ncbi:MAG: Terminase large subunit [uncultured Sulfurovum sp.]|uniref:Terminase large subunit n=1 Tax=uncultured Sulfurovum sp. TaxID=269237 RepID=A0A6S6ST40_9BACT|nr:MAG: Terminase large subunit [uncultured Sulfurovum sp.]